MFVLLRYSFLLLLSAGICWVFSFPAYANDPPGTAGVPQPAGANNQGTIGGDAGGARINGNNSSLESQLRQQGFIKSSNASGNGTSPGAQSVTRTEPNPDGGTRTVTTGPDGSRTIVMVGRNVEPANLTIIFDKDGHVIKQDEQYTEGRTRTMTYSPSRGVRESETHTADGGVIKSTSHDNGQSTTTFSYPGKPTQTETEDAQGNRIRSTPNADGTTTQVTIPRGGPSTTTTIGADGKPDSSETVYYDPSGRFFERRVTTDYDANGNPVKTSVRTRGRYVSEMVTEETDYWPGTRKPKTTRRRDNQGNLQEVIYYDQNGKETRRSREPGYTPYRDLPPYLVNPGPSGGYIHTQGQPQQNNSSASTDQQSSASTFGDQTGVGDDPYASNVDGRNFVGFEDADQIHQDEARYDHW